MFLKNICMGDIEMLYYDRIQVFEVNKTSASKECIICHHWYFLNKRFKFQPNVCNGFHDVLMMSMDLNNIAILNIRGVDYRHVTNGIRKCEIVNLLQNADLVKKVDH